MDAAEFLTSIKRRASQDAAFEDPLAEVVQLIEQSPDTAECLALRKLIHVLTTKQGTFREAEAWLFSGRIAGLTAALIDARLDGRYTEEEWQRACLS